MIAPHNNPVMATRGHAILIGRLENIPSTAACTSNIRHKPASRKALDCSSSRIDGSLVIASEDRKCCTAKTARQTDAAAKMAAAIITI